MNRFHLAFQLSVSSLAWFARQLPPITHSYISSWAKNFGKIAMNFSTAYGPSRTVQPHTQPMTQISALVVNIQQEWIWSKGY